MLSYFNRISIVFVWIGESDSNALPVDVYFFANGGKNLRFKTIRIRVDGDLKLPLRQTVNVRFKLNQNLSNKKINSKKKIIIIIKK